jgi:flagella basal body P-ring formation protein FlgA
MKKTLNLILIALMITVFGVPKADAAMLSEQQAKKLIEQQLVKIYRNYTDAELSINVVAVPFKDIEVPSGKISAQVSTSADKFMARDLIKVTLYANGKAIKSFNAPTIIKAYKDVLVASDSIAREKTISPRVVVIQRKEISNNFSNVLTADSLNKEIVAKKYFSEGEVIDKRFVKIKPDVLRNAIVTVVFNTNNLSISLEGKALSDGAIGDNICIMNKNYNRIYKGTVVGENKVLVCI